ncbi:hypothetical protein V3851_17805 [Paenibacillus sp. M1]|uniref:Uncharacterized protein n=1 Tax=Paenibacillus haidiansis TaxID=1574488 RepID=A0ABU7VVA7_9BACL
MAGLQIDHSCKNTVFADWQGADKEIPAIVQEFSGHFRLNKGSEGKTCIFAGISSREGEMCSKACTFAGFLHHIIVANKTGLSHRSNTDR